MSHFFKFVYKNILWIFLVIFLLLFMFGAKAYGMHYYEKTDFYTGLVTANALNVRSGPGANYNIVSQVYKNEYIRVFAKVGDWYVIQTDKDFIGAVSKDYVKPIYPNTTENQAEQQTEEITNSTNLTADEREAFNLINEQRKKEGLEALQIDDEVQNVARVKAKDMVNNNYFSHTSPTYGSPFDMLKKYGISYKSAGENIAGNGTAQGAVNAWMNSPGHKANILNSKYNYTGIAVVTSPKYGKILVQLFIGR